jgi:hypothetical protein
MTCLLCASAPTCFRILMPGESATPRTFIPAVGLVMRFSCVLSGGDECAAVLWRRWRRRRQPASNWLQHVGDENQELREASHCGINDEGFSRLDEP